MADKYGLSVLLDLHGAPGSQNGQDHSGCNTFGTNWSQPAHIALSLATVDALMARYGHRSALLGIELLNEPSRSLETEQHATLRDFYGRAYKIVRSYSRSAWVVFNCLYEESYVQWERELREPEFVNVVLDLHLYNWQAPFTDMSVAGHVREARKWGGLIRRLGESHPVLVGEWSFSTGTHQAGQLFADACVSSFSNGLGSYLWSWTVERLQARDVNKNCIDEWDVKHQMETASGIKV